MDALYMIAEVLVAPFSTIALKARLVTALVRVKSGKEIDEESADVSSMLRRSISGERTRSKKTKGMLSTLLKKYLKPNKYKLHDNALA